MVQKHAACAQAFIGCLRLEQLPSCSQAQVLDAGCGWQVTVAGDLARLYILYQEGTEGAPLHAHYL